MPTEFLLDYILHSGGYYIVHAKKSGVLLRVLLADHKTDGRHYKAAPEFTESDFVELLLLLQADNWKAIRTAAFRAQQDGERDSRRLQKVLGYFL